MADAPKWEGIVQKTELKLRSVFTQLHTIWSDVGFSEEVCSKYCDQVYKHIEDLLNDMVAESEQRKEITTENIKQLMDQMETICHELNTTSLMNGYENLPLKVVEDLLRNDLQKLQYRKDQRLAHLRELLAKERNICKVLGTQPIGIKKHLPSEEELSSFKLYLEKQEGERNRVEIIFKDMRRNIVKMIDELGVMPTSNFERLVYDEPENFVLNSNNMLKLGEFHNQLKEQVEDAKKHVESMKTELVAFWKYLNEPEYVCQSFIDSCVGYNQLTITALSKELARCKEKRAQNIARYVAQVRTELTKLWDLCKYTEAQRQKFLHFNSQMYTEDLLTLHELEVERVQKFYESNKSIFELFEKRENLWMKMKELLQRANNPDRFYNRGGQLLMEEKERKKIQIKLPKIEEELKCLITDYELTHKEAFLINGMAIEELLKESWENLNEEKQTIKKARKEAKDKSIKKTPLSTSRKAILGSSKKTPTVISTRRLTPLSLSKRKLLWSPSPNTSAKRRNLSITNRSKTAKNGKSPKRILKSGNALVRSRHEKENSVSHSSTVTDTTYSQFKEHLEEKKELRSSLLPEKVLMNANKSRMKTPVRTPVKPLRKNLVLPTTPNATPKLSQSRSINKTPRSPKLVPSSGLVTVSTPLPIIF